MLIGRDGTSHGSVSGGCLEADLTQRARWVVGEKKSALVSFSTIRSESEGAVAIKGCGGDVELLVEPLGDEWLDELSKRLEQTKNHRDPIAIATVIKSGANSKTLLGGKLIVAADSITTFDFDDDALIDRIGKDIRGADCEGTITRLYGHAKAEVELFIEYLKRPTRLLLIGAGEIAFRIAGIAREIGWQCVVADHRVGRMDGLKPASAETVSLSSPIDLRQEVNPERSDAAVILTHICEADLVFLEELLATEIKYVGLLGSRSRVSGLLEMLRQVPGFDERRLSRVYGPAGLDIGSEAPPTVALSIVAEIQAVLSGCEANSLRSTRGD